MPSVPLPALAPLADDLAIEPPDTTAEMFPEIGGDRPVLRHGRIGDQLALARLLVETGAVREWPILTDAPDPPDELPLADAHARESVVANVAGGLRALLADVRARVWVAQIAGENGPQIVGFGAVSWRPDPLNAAPQACVEILLVLPAWRGRGTGTRILQACRATARVVGSTLIAIGPALMVATTAANPRITAFFRRHGFLATPAGLHRAP